MAARCGWKYNMPRADSRLSNAFSSKKITAMAGFLDVDLVFACCTACSFCFWLLWIWLKLSQPSMSLSPVTKADSVVKNMEGRARWDCGTWWYFDDLDVHLICVWCAFSILLWSIYVRLGPARPAHPWFCSDNLCVFVSAEVAKPH